MRVLLAFDGSAGAAEAVSLARTMAWPDGSRLRVVSVVELEAWMSSLPRPTGTARPVLETEIAAYFEEEQRRIVELFSPARDVETVVLRGRPATAIVEEARNFAADLVIVGSRGHGVIATLILGSVSAEVVDHAPSPVLVARRPALSHVVMATDDSPSARAAEDVVAGWPVFEGMPIDVVSVANAVRPWTSGVAPGFQRQAREAYSQELDEVSQVAESVAGDAAKRLRATGRLAEAMVRRGDPAAEIVKLAEERRADLVVLGSRGRSALAEILLGSVARNVLAGSKASVLVVRGAAANEDRGAVR
jgi:nucleotide-binding universal stress UspA family protein